MRGGGGAATVGLILLPLLLWAAPASASDGPQSLIVDGHAWSWRRALPAGLPADEPSQVPTGDLAVAYDGSPDATPAKATYLHFDLSGLSTTATVTSLTLTLPVDPAAQTLDTGGARLIACRLLSDFASGEGADPASMPAADCKDPVTGTFDAAAAAWSFSLTDLARQWLTGANHGLVIRPALDYAAPADPPFQIDFVGAAELRAELVAAVPAAGPQPASQPDPPPAVGTSDLSSVAGPPALPVGPPMRAPAVQGPALAAPPVVAAQAPPAAQAAPSAATVLPPPRYSTGAVYSLGGLLILLLVAVSRAVGDTSGPLAYARAERRRLDRLRRPTRASLLAPVVPGQPVQSRQGRRPMSAAASSVT